MKSLQSSDTETKLSPIYIPIGSISEEGLYEGKEINPIISMLYDTAEICGYTIINKYIQSGFSIILKSGTRPIIVHGYVSDIQIHRGLLQIYTCEDIRVQLINSHIEWKYLYILRKDLTQKVFVPYTKKNVVYNAVANLLRLNYWLMSKTTLGQKLGIDVRLQGICSIAEIDRLNYDKNHYSISLT